MFRICTIILYLSVSSILGSGTSISPIFWACKGLESWSCVVWTCLMPVSCVSKDSSYRVSSCVSAGMILACNPVFWVITSSSCSSGPGTGQVLVPLVVPSTESLRALLWCFSVSLMTHLEKGIDGDMNVFIVVPIATNDGYSDCCDKFGITY